MDLLRSDFMYVIYGGCFIYMCSSSISYMLTAACLWMYWLPCALSATNKSCVPIQGEYKYNYKIVSWNKSIFEPIESVLKSFFYISSNVSSYFQVKSKLASVFKHLLSKQSCHHQYAINIGIVWAPKDPFTISFIARETFNAAFKKAFKIEKSCHCDIIRFGLQPSKDANTCTVPPLTYMHATCKNVIYFILLQSCRFKVCILLMRL